jgi:hypothetical protein
MACGVPRQPRSRTPGGRPTMTLVSILVLVLVILLIVWLVGRL